MRQHWTLDPAVVFLNHGSFGACPKPVLQYQSELRALIEREPVQFFVNELPHRLDGAREAIAAFAGARAEDIGFVRNATSGVNSVLRSLRFAPGDELLTTDHTYNACRNALDFVAARWEARVVTATVPFPLDHPDQVVESLVSAVTSRTRLALVDHVTSKTGLVLPIAEIAAELNERGVDTLVDGAHAPGMVPLALDQLGVAYYAANFHKWVCAPKGAGMLWVRADRQEQIHPLVISHGFNSPRPRKRFLEEMDWTGTDDPTPVLSVPEAIRFVGSLAPGGWSEVRGRNRDLALVARRILADAIGTPMPAPESMIGSLAALPLPNGAGSNSAAAFEPDPLATMLFETYRIEVPIFPWPAPPARLVRVSAHLYNREEEYRVLAKRLVAVLGKG